MTSISVVNIPIESLVDRYSENWNRNFPKALSCLGEVYTVYPELPLATSVVQGEFLNVLDTNRFKALQLAEVISLIQSGRVTDKTILFFHDLWFPGIESLFYIRDALGLKFKIAGMFHAGTWDTHDFLFKKGMSSWARHVETSWVSQIDLPMVSTTFHLNLMEERLGVSKKLRVVPFPLWHLPSQVDFSKKKNIIVFPHRLAEEKNFRVFDEIPKELFPNWKLVKTKDVCKSKQDYFDLLAISKIAVSCAQQETWGIAQIEATSYGCLPLVPDALSYAELYPDRYRYKVMTDHLNVPRSIAVSDLLPMLKELTHRLESGDLNLEEEILSLRSIMLRTDPRHIIQALSTLQ